MRNGQQLTVETGNPSENQSNRSDDDQVEDNEALSSSSNSSNGNDSSGDSDGIKATVEELIASIANQPSCQQQPLLAVLIICHAMNQCAVGPVASKSQLFPKQSPAATKLDDFQQVMLTSSIDSDELAPAREAGEQLTACLDAFFEQVADKSERRELCNYVIRCIYQYCDPVFYAYLTNDLKTISQYLQEDQSLLSRQFPQYTRTPDKTHTLVSLAMEKKRYPLLDRLMAGGAGVDRTMITAADKGDCKALACFVKSPVFAWQVNNLFVEGMAAIHLAAQGGHFQALQLLVAHGAEVDLQFVDQHGNYGPSALLLATLAGSVDMVAYLLQHGATARLTGPTAH